VGRDEECAQLDEVLEDARASRSRALAILGEAGLGKSSLLSYATAKADDFVVLRAVGFESDAELAFSGLYQLLRPLLDRLDELPAHQSRSLGAALGLAAAEEADRMTIGVATLGLLALAAENADLLVAVDDAQWLDRASMDAILFAARRFEADRVAVIFTVREDGSAFSTTGFEELRLEGLGPEATRALLDAKSPVELAPEVADRLYELTSGNPLALVELPHVLSVAQLDGHASFDQPLNLGTRVERAFRGRMEALGPEAQQALLIASASESDRLDTIVATLAEAGISPSALQDAEDSELISLDAESLLFRHPLARSAVYHAAAPSERRAAHAAMARALGAPRDVERRAWHLASAAVGPDEDVAAALESAASAARERVGYAGASAAYERAARLSPAEEPRLRRLLAAADAGWLAGQTSRAVTLLEEALGVCHEPLLRGRLLNLRGHIARHTGDPGAAFEMLTEAAQLLDGVSPLEAAAARVGAWRCCVLLGRGGLECAQTLSERAERDDGIQEFFASLALGAELRRRGDDEGWMLLERAEALADEKGDAMFARSPQYVSLAGMPSQELGNVETGLRICAWAIAWARERGLYGALPLALTRKGWFERGLDQWNAAYASYSEAAAIAAEQGFETFELTWILDLAWFEARRGEEAACIAHVAHARELARSLRRSLGPESIGVSTIAELHLGLGRVEEAIAGYEILVLPAESAPLPPQLQYVPDLVEAYVMVGRPGDAERLIEPFTRHVEAAPSSLGEAQLARCKGVVADDETFEDHFVEALARHSGTTGGFEEARTRLCFGERLRRVRRRRDARDQLRPALELFERFGAAPWAERTRGELRATGERLRARGPEHEDLTGQELRIALQAAEGKTNRQIGAAMFLSPKTVEFHLGRAYRKLGIGSRAELIRHFAAQAALPKLHGEAQ
jgi:DNA-binding CsgD family transcriptional regulator